MPYAWIIAGLLLPIPIIHFWMHARLSFWRRHVWLGKLFNASLWAGALWGSFRLHGFAPSLFVPGLLPLTIGWMLLFFCVVLIVSAVIALKPKRFFLAAVIRPEIVEQVRVHHGIYRFLDHPAYVGYVLLPVATFLLTGASYFIGLTVYLFTLMPLVILLEQEELGKRVGE